MTRMYISGPIFGHKDLNRPAFASAAEQIRRDFGQDGLEIEIVNPHDVKPLEHEGRRCPRGRQGAEGHTDACHMRADIAALCTCDALALLPGWQNSFGARTELQIATVIGCSIWYLTYSLLFSEWNLNMMPTGHS